MSNVQTTNVVFTEGASTSMNTTCDDLEGTNALQCTGDFTWTESMSQSFTQTEGVTLAEGVTVSLKESFEVVEATEGISFTVSESFTESETTDTVQTYSTENGCNMEVGAGECDMIIAAFAYGTVTADYTATITCSSGVVSSTSGTMEFDHVYTTDMTGSCTAVGLSAESCVTSRRLL
jgi:hypothetical protein